MTILCLSFGVEKTEGRPTSTIIAGKINQLEMTANAHGPETQAINSVKKRRLADVIVSCG